MTQILNGILLAKKTQQALLSLFSDTSKANSQPHLAIILVGNDPASQIYVTAKQTAAEKLGFKVSLHHLDENISATSLKQVITELNNNKHVHGILLQLPLPPHLHPATFLNDIAPEKDVDGLNAQNIGYLFQNQQGFIPCTPQACIQLIKEYTHNLAGKHVVLVGQSPLVGRPLSLILLHYGATVTVTHTQTQDLKTHTLSADIVVTAIGKPHQLDHSYFNKNACIIDVGINRLPGEKEKIVGDVDYHDCLNKVAAITPVPGGVGPLTVTYVLVNLWQAYCAQEKIPNRFLSQTKN